MADTATRTGRRIGPELVRGAREALRHKRGALPEASVTRALVTVRGTEVDPPPEFASEDVRRIREELALSQSVFAQLIGASVASVRAWEQGERKPSLMARRLLELADREPRVLEEALTVRSTE